MDLSDSVIGLKGCVACSKEREFHQTSVMDVWRFDSATLCWAPHQYTGFRFNRLIGQGSRSGGRLAPFPSRFQSSPVIPLGNLILPKQMLLYIHCAPTAHNWLQPRHVASRTEGHRITTNAPPSSTRIHLRALQASGVVSSTERSRWVLGERTYIG